MIHRNILLAAAAVSAIAAVPASASVFTIQYYSSFTQDSNGITVSGPAFFTEGVDDLTYVDFNAANAPVGRPNANQQFAAIITGNFAINSAAQHFTIGSDDGAFLYLNGVLAGKNPGVHGYSTIEADANFAPGIYSLEVDYFNGPCCGAAVGITAKGVTFVPPPSGVPEPASWAMMVGGFGLLGGALRRQRTTVRFA